MQSTASILRLVPRMAMVSQARNTWILRRRLPVPPRPSWESEYVVGDHIKDINPHDLVPEDMNLYDHNDIINTDDTPAPPVKVILLKHVEGIGNAGEVLEVEALIARNQLILAQNAVYADEFNLKWYKDVIENADISEAPSSKLSPFTIRELKKSVFSLLMNGSKPWTVEPWHVRAALRLGGVVVPESSIILPKEKISGPDENLQNKVFIVNVKINNKEVRPTRIVLHHSHLQKKEEWFAGQLEPIFESDREVLSSLPVIPRTIEDDEY